MSERLPENNLYAQLKSLIDDSEHKEHECRQYLQYARYLLFRETVIRFVYVETEYRGHSGDSDYVISGEVRDESGVQCIRAYIWELKAPQCFIFERGTKNRLRPSEDLIQAENQLLHYYLEQKGSSQFRDEFGVTHPDNVRLGGIIIGCNRTKVNGEYEESKKVKLYEKAMRTRRMLYDPSGIRLMTWDHILEHLQPPEFNLRVEAFDASTGKPLRIPFQIQKLPVKSTEAHSH